MKLIDILVEELPKRGGWPAKASHAVYVKRLSKVFFTKGGAPSIVGDDFSIFETDGAGRDVFWVPDAIFDCEEPIDYATAIITREQYEAALAAKNDGWIEWGGGECPVHHGVIIDAKDRDGYIHHGEVVGESIYIDDIFWRRGVCALEDNEIIAYRLHKPQEVEQAEADDEADLNECIGQDAVLVWNGEGVIPPVGCVCERSWAGDEWQSCKILFASGQIVVVKLKESDREDAYNIGDVTFRPIRPIRSEEDEKRDEAIAKITDAICGEVPDTGMATAAKYAARAYDAIVAGKIPGVKLEV